MTTRLPTYFISHGGGPWPWVPKMRVVFAGLEAALKQMIADLPVRPKAILMVSGHWEETTATVMGAARPPMVYDYSGFPPETYEIEYNAPGAPELAKQTAALLEAAGIPAAIDDARGYDHGTFSVMEVMYPEADIPLYQLSLLKSYDPAAHIAIGRALAPLRDAGVLIIGSGLSFHNLRMFGPAGVKPSAEFDAWLGDAMAQTPDVRETAMLNWEDAPSARICHVNEDHLVPLFVALGAAENETATRIFHEVNDHTGITVSNFKFG